MNVQLRNGNGYPSRGGFRYPGRQRRSGIGADPGVNVTTIWTPSGGWSGSGSGPAVYQAPTPIAPPACSQDTRPGGAAFSSACIAQLLATQQQNMAQGTAANYNVDVQNCLNTFPQPPDCYSRTFGLTLPGTTGGSTADIVNAAALLGDPAAKALAAEGVPPTPPVTTPQQTPKATPPQQGGTTADSTNATSSSSSSSGAALVSAPINPMLYWIAGLAAVALIISAVK